MQHYYLLNGTVKKGGQMPDEKYIDILRDYKQHYNNWLSSLQQCEISEGEIMKIYVHLFPNLSYNKQDINPINITDIVEDNNGVITFKQPKQVESECEAVEFAEWITTCGYSIEGGLWHNFDLLIDVNQGITTKQLYEIFKNR